MWLSVSNFSQKYKITSNYVRNKKLFALFYEFCCLYLTAILHFAAPLTAMKTPFVGVSREHVAVVATSCPLT